MLKKTIKNESIKKSKENWRNKDPVELVTYSLINGIDKYIVEDIENIKNKL